MIHSQRVRSRRGICFCLTLALILCCALPVAAAEKPAVSYGEAYCFVPADFQGEFSHEVAGIFVTGVPAMTVGQVRLNDRVIRAGDVLSAEQVSAMVFQPATRETTVATISYMPIFENSVEKETTMTISIRGNDKTAPTVENTSFETYKNLAKEGALTAADPEGSAVTYTIVKQPKRGDLAVNADGTFTYTPKKNKVGKDSFTFTATDEAGNVSAEGTVSIEILKPLDNAAYKDMTQSSHQFEALWMKNTGLFTGTQVAGENCFQPETPITRGEFLAMAMKLLEIPVQEASFSSGFADENDAADWLRPYLSAAMRAGIVSGSQTEKGLCFRPNDNITQAEAAVMLQGAMALQTAETVSEDVPAWAEDAVSAMAYNGVSLNGTDAILTRVDAAVALYQVSKLTEAAPGLAVFRAE